MSSESYTRQRVIMSTATRRKIRDVFVDDVTQGTVYYKWSMKMDPQNPLNGNEHQLVFFESHMCEVKYGGSQGNSIQFWANGQPGMFCLILYDRTNVDVDHK